ncbi:hypothetical protein H9657_05820 [Cellulomonas sp. Sa3CUA2]|uniref:Lipoprotein n=1 Tax=Cellulomonas avistercoris TaxID=2762242 RepID=A0ABR8QBI3_9CELL|nr:hypothetical protein [Cellulomonas avistercoris]MBD7917794.1 hypothetical protein [Cellulomonas avistercoris]
MRRTIHHGAAVGAAALCALLALGACDGGSATPTPTATAATTAPPGGTPTTDGPQEDDVTTRLAEALRAEDPALADLVTSDGTTVTPLDTPWLTGWQVLDVLARGGSHGSRAYVALSDDDRAVVLAGSPDAFVDLLAQADVRVEDAATAAAVVDTYLDATRSFTQWSQRIASFDDVRLRPRLDADAQAAADAARAALDGQVAPTTATPTADGFDVVAWVQDGATVARHTVRLTGDGELEDSVQDVVTDLPVPISR